MPRSKTVRLRLRATYPTAAAAIKALRREIQRLSLLDYDPTCVPGQLLRAWYYAWPSDDYVFQDGSGWDDDEIRAGRFYDVSADFVEHERAYGWYVPVADAMKRYLVEGNWDYDAEIKSYLEEQKP